MDQSKFSIVIPSKVIDNNLINCEYHIRAFYKEIKIFLLVDFNNANNKFSSNTYIIETGLVNVSEKRNIGIKLTKTEYIVFIDSDAYPEHPWLNNIEKIFKVNVTKINIINKQNRTKLTRGRKVKVSGFKKAIITLKKGQSIDLTTGI